MEECLSDPNNADNSAKDLEGIADMYWVGIFYCPVIFQYQFHTRKFSHSRAIVCE